VATGLAGVTGVTVANGGDNIAAYTPVFRTISSTSIAVTLAVFVIGHSRSPRVQGGLGHAR
jgi:cadmium resistance protein CadD (predicted permease)